MKHQLLIISAAAIAATAIGAERAPESAVGQIQVTTCKTPASAAPSIERVPGVKGVRKAGRAAGPDAMYWAPVYRQFSGFTLDGSLNYLPTSTEFYPVNVPITWENMSDDDGNATYQWTYPVLDDRGMVVNETSDDQEQLTVTYHPDYTSEKTCRNNLYPLPSLTATADGASATYKGEAKRMQMGGKLDFELLTNEPQTFGILPFNIATEGLGVYTAEPITPGGLPVPVFGYSADSDQWWYDYTFSSPEGTQERFSYVSGYMNYIIPSEAPMVVYGASAGALAKISDDSYFRFEIRALEDDGEIIEQPIAVAITCGKDAVIVDHDPETGLDYLSLNFKLDEPVVFDAAEHPAGYLVEVSGFHKPGVTYFAPLQSIKPNPYEYCFGFYRHHRLFLGVEEDSYSYCAFFQNEYGDLYTSFAISLDACYPWLDADTDVVEVSEDKPTSVPLGSYYDGSELTVSAPDWLNVKISGRYYYCDAKFTIVGTPQSEGKVTISAPGVSKTFTVKASGSGICSVDADAPATGDIYNAQGILVKRNGTEADLRALPQGIYIHNHKAIRN